MADSIQKRDTVPFWWWGRVPVYATTLMVFAILVGLFLSVFHATASPGKETETVFTFGFFPHLFWHYGKWWQVLTHPFVNFPNFFSIFSLFFLYNFGIGLESHLGRRVYIRIVLLLCLVPAAVKSVWYLFGGGYPPAAGDYEISIGIFVAFATLYPNVEQWNWMTMKWLAFAGILLCSLMYFPRHDWEGLSVLLTTCGVAHALVRYESGHWTLPGLKFPRRRTKLRVLPKPTTPPRPAPAVERAPEPDSLASEVDALLDKIVKSGIDSLSAAEKARLEKARQELLRKDRK